MNFQLQCPYVQDVLLKLLCSWVVLIFFILFSLVIDFFLFMQALIIVSVSLLAVQSLSDVSFVPH
jgi:hypothetical protein